MDIACARCHAERAINQIRKSHILDGVMPIPLTQHANQILDIYDSVINIHNCTQMKLEEILTGQIELRHQEQGKHYSAEQLP